LENSVSEYSNYQKEKECQRKTNAAVEQSFSVIYQNVLKRVAMPSVLETNNI